MTSLVEKKPINQQEFSYYLLFAVLLLFFVLAVTLSLVYALPRLENRTLTRVSIGEAAAFPSAERPYAVKVEDTALFIVRTETGWLALDRHTPYEMSVGRCLFAWTEANDRFEDPCSGSKFSLTGQLIDGPAVQNLDQYPITENSGELFVDLTTLIPGEHADPIQ